MPFGTNFRQTISRTIALSYLQSQSRRHLHEYPRLAIFAFDFIGHHINAFGRYEKAELDKLGEIMRAEGRLGTALDVGANIGNHTVFFAGLFDVVHAFEPNPDILPLLRYNTRQIGNVVVHPFGASSSDGKMTAEIPWQNLGGGRVVANAAPSGGRTVEFDLRRLDGLAELQRDARVDFVKLDIEGHEEQALEGMSGLLGRDGPFVAIEQQADQVRNHSTPAIERLRALGYAHIYEIRSGQSRISQRLPKIIRAPLRIMEAGIADPSAKASVVPVKKLERRTYPLLLLTREPLTSI